MDDREIVRGFYDAAPADEWDRLAENPWEFAINAHYIDRYVRPGDRVLDLGGGPGRYAIHLAERGAAVTLVDLSAGNVALAREKAAEAGVRFEAGQGDALDAAGLPAGPFDHVLLMGPLYHLLEAGEREAAIRNCVDRLRPGGTLFAAFISTYGGLLYYVQNVDAMPQALREAKTQLPAFHDCAVHRADFAGQGFTRAYFAHPDSVPPHFAPFPLAQLHLVGSEGLFSAQRKNMLKLPAEDYAAWLELSLAMCEFPELLSWSEHLLYIGRKM